MHKTKQACSLPAPQLKLIEFKKKLSSRVCWCVFVFACECFVFMRICGCAFSAYACIFCLFVLICVGAWQLRGCEVNPCLKVWVVKKFYLH